MPKIVPIRPIPIRTHPRGVEECDVRDILNRHREQNLIPRFRQVGRKQGLLRRKMVDELLRQKPVTVPEFFTLIPPSLLAKTDPVQWAALPEVIAILARYWGEPRGRKSA